MEAAIILTYRCVCRCYMCNIWKYPTNPEEEIKPEHIEKLPDNLAFCNLTGGEPFLRDDIEEIVDIVMRKSKRVVISTNGWFTEKIVNIAKKYPKIGIRVSLEGLPAANDELRGMKDGFDHGLRTLLELQRIGCKDIGFGITVSDRNAKDMIELYQLAKGLGFEFATAVTHNSYYFHKYDNTFKDPKMIEDCFKELIIELLRTKRVKNWFRAYFNYGLIRKVRGQPRLLPCEAGTENFFVTPFGEVVPCNGSPEPWVMGNLKYQDWDEIWNGEQAQKVREKVRNCDRHCWMIGTAAPVMKKYIWKPLKWVIKNKLRVMMGKEPCLD
ncbi:MAG: radical SAM protein [Candidatus Desulfofervidus auxilii]|nr:radical SAM protein [Candidatus Desulfofervidus auxilii]